MSKARRSGFRWVLISLMATALVALLAARWAVPYAVRWHMLGKLTSSDPAQRSAALDYVARHAEEQPAVLERAVGVLTGAEGARFLEIVGALQRAGRWSHPPVPTEAWLRWIDLLAEETDPEARILAAERIAELRGEQRGAGDPQAVRQRLSALMRDPQPAVRYAAVLAAARLAGANASARQAYGRRIHQSTEDPAPGIARHAWLLTALLRPEVDLKGAEAPTYGDGPVAIAKRFALAALRSDVAAQGAGGLEDAVIAYGRGWRIEDGENRPATDKAGEGPSPEGLRRFFRHPVAPLRDGACVVAASAFGHARNRELIAALLGSYDDREKMSGAVLSGLTGLRADLLREKAEAEDVWAVKQVQRLGLWMQGSLPSMTGEVRGLLARQDIPPTTVLLAMLHRGDAAAIVELLAPHAEEPTFDAARLGLDAPDRDRPVTLRELLVELHWWPVLRHYLPEQAPALWMQADQRLQRLQIDLLRDWFVVHPPASVVEPATANGTGAAR